LALTPGFMLTALAGAPTPLEPLSEAIMLLTPVNLANVLLEALGNFARLAALLGAIAICLPIGGLLALCSPEAAGGLAEGTRRVARDTIYARWLRWAGVAGLALLLAVPLALSAQDRAEALAALLTGLLFAPALWLTRRLQARQVYRDTLVRRPSTDPANAPEGSLARRELFRRVAGSAATVAGALALGSYDLWSGALGALVGRGETIRTLFSFVAPGPRRPGFPVAGEEPEVTSVARFYRVSKNDHDPEIQPVDWSLKVFGAVDRPFTLSYTELVAQPRVDEYVTLRCVDDPPQGHLMSNAYWSGVRLSTLLDRAGVHSSGAAVVMRAPDAYAEIVPIADARSDFALLAYGMNGQTLPWRHGGPARVLVPGYVGLKNVKWVESLEVVSALAPGFWAEQGWTAAHVHSVARIDVWHPTAQGIAGIEIGGVAFGGAKGVSTVMVRADDGDWQPATLDTPALSPLAWVQWHVTLPLAPGTHQVTARMTDGAGTPQEAAATSIFPNGATGLHTITITI
jgi:DMSO/TMAO reductase YedYZ molybdopterin-dependent catalytic subunit